MGRVGFWLELRYLGWILFLGKQWLDKWCIFWLHLQIVLTAIPLCGAKHFMIWIDQILNFKLNFSEVGSFRCFYSLEILSHVVFTSYMFDTYCIYTSYVWTNTFISPDIHLPTANYSSWWPWSTGMAGCCLDRTDGTTGLSLWGWRIWVDSGGARPESSNRWVDQRGLIMRINKGRCVGGKEKHLVSIYLYMTLCLYTYPCTSIMPCLVVFYDAISAQRGQDRV